MQKTFIQITSGRGPEECCRVVVLVMEKLMQQAKELGIQCQLIDYEQGLRDGCLFSSTMVTEGEPAQMTDFHRLA